MPVIKVDNRQHALRPGPNRVGGRGSHTDIVIQNDRVSETHAKLQRRDDGWSVVDAGSTAALFALDR